MVYIRPVKKEEYKYVHDFIENILKEEFPDEAPLYNYDDLDDIGKSYSGEKEIFLVAEKDNTIVGTIAVKEDSPDVALLRRIFVHKDYRGKGYGAKLLCTAINFCFQHGYKSIIFRGSSRMRNALQLCLQNGFKKNEEIDLGNNLQLIILKKELKQPSVKTEK